MEKLKKWNRRRGDNRAATKPDYASIQSVSVEVEGSRPDHFTDPDGNLLEPDTQNSRSKDLSQKPKFESAKASSIIALMGVTGGVGTTSIAIQLAQQAAQSVRSDRHRSQRPKDPSVCVIDLDFESGACAHHLDLIPSLTLEKLSCRSEDIDKAYVQSVLTTHDCGVALIASPNIMQSQIRIDPRNVMAVLDVAAEMFQTVIIDLPRYQKDWTFPIMKTVDALGLVGELTIPSLHAMRTRLDLIAEPQNSAVNPHAIISKYERRSFKNGLRLKDAETALGHTIPSTICIDPDTLNEALNSGKPAGEIKPDSRFVKDVKKLSKALIKNDKNALLEAA